MTSRNTDELVADPAVALELSISLMSIWRRDNDPRMAEAGWPVRVHIRGRNYRSRKQLEAYKAAELKRAMTDARKKMRKAKAVA